MNPRQLLIVLGIALAGFGAAFAISGASGGAEPVAAEKPPGAADVIEPGAAEVTASVPASGNLPALRVPVKKKKAASTSSSSTAPSTGTGATVAPSSGTTPPPSSTTPAPSAPAPPVAQPDPAPAPPAGGGGGGGGFQTQGGED